MSEIDISKKCRRCIGKNKFCRYFKTPCDDIEQKRCTWKKCFSYEEKLKKIKDLLITCENNFGKPCAECKYSDQCSEIDTDSYILQIIEE